MTVFRSYLYDVVRQTDFRTDRIFQQCSLLFARRHLRLLALVALTRFLALVL